jgi:carboxymethylenebutenolidase
MCYEEDCGAESVDRRAFLAAGAVTITGLDATGSPVSSQDKGAATSPRVLDDATIQHEMVSFKSGQDTVEGYLARPKAVGQYRAVIVLHGDFRVPEGQRNTAAQLAQAGFVGLAYNRFGRWPALTPQELLKSDQSDKRFLSWSFVQQELGDALAAIKHLQAQSFVKQGGVAVVGFCGGGYEALLLAARSKDVRAVVSFYAPPVMPERFQHLTDRKPSLLDEAAKIKVPVQGHYGADDPLVPLEDVRKFEQALKAQGTAVTIFTYAGATHAFYDYTRRFYHADAAAQAKSRMIAFLKEHLK